MKALDKSAAYASSKSNAPAAGQSPQKAETASLAAYIADMSAELSNLAERSDLKMLAQFLSLARVEAELRSRELGGFKISRRTFEADTKNGRRPPSEAR
jgi:hypothetical protein